MDESLLLGLYTADAMRKIDELAIKGFGIPGGHLMERAGVGVAGEILERYEPEEAVVFAGKGNNGGDGFVVARELFDAGVEVTVFTLAPAGAYEGDAKLNLDILGRLGVDVREAFAADAPADEVVMLTEMADVVVDAIFGTGFTGAAKGAAAEVIGLINEAPGVVVSVDVASGVGASTGVVNGPAVDGRPHRGPARRQGRPLRDPGRRALRRGRRRAHRHPGAARPRRRRVAAQRGGGRRPGRAQGRRSTTSARSARCSSSAARRA